MRKWAVVMTAREPGALVEANVRWHLGTGAAQVHVYLDRSDDPVAVVLAQIPGCRVTVCDAAHWQALRPRRGAPASQMRRQSLNAAHAQERCEADWLVHLDADEFLWQDSPLGAELPVVAELGAELRFAVLERSLMAGQGQAGLFDGVFRRASPGDKALDAVIYGALAPHLREGMFSHGSGKCAVPVGQGFRQMVHESYLESGGKRRRAPAWLSTTTRLLHFDGVTPLHWLLKLIRYKGQPLEVQKHILPPHRLAQIAWMVERMGSLDEALEAEAALHRLTQPQAERLRGFGLLDEGLSFDPGALPDMPDLSVAAFDRALLAQDPALWEMTGWRAA
ncbi:glycosyltransferase family 2 protein [Ponticoccus alexandrii]|uniref:Glycosyl transferase family 2 n=1 Tax=Ponticoccus alexandrii TaxID=1943633 RepID=A0ABX7FAP3_9RHOB|nr:glycosyltransferase family 2 protein [Ponticoccus alexandrii]ETA52760.1 hypothetical protein P279_06895 [Rhodobacteraceae bacterium PD-2]QRF67625.1 hypothetical protein GQA70_15690 [Ponticoccus alexandrii]